MKKDKLLQMEINYKKLIKYRKKLDKMLSKSKDVILSDVNLVIYDSKIDEITINLINLKKEFEKSYNEKIVFYKSRVYERI
ncbi:MAG TPA: hypothetical protein GXZ90_10420 [Clostridiales bacterium]|nr:hypothetical protein [Clostridiales bacterium]